MSDLKFTDDGALALTSTNDIQLVIGDDEIRQRLLLRLLTLQGSYFLDTDFGFPLFAEVLTGRTGVNISRLETIYRIAISETPGVSSIESLALSVDSATRQLSIAVNVKTVNQGIIALELAP